jgi:hypothetical protein
MNCSLLASLSLRITGVIILVNVLTHLPKEFLGLIRLSEQASHYTSAYPVSMLFLLSVLSIVLPTILGLLFLLFPLKISKIIVDGNEGGTAAAVNLEDVQLIIFSSLGAYFVAMALFDAVYLMAKLRIYFSFVENSEIMARAPKMLPQDFASIVSTFFQLAIGMYLLLGSKGLSRLITHLRGKPITG